jgi:hypothetical protein
VVWRANAARLETTAFLNACCSGELPNKVKYRTKTVADVFVHFFSTVEHQFLLGTIQRIFEQMLESGAYSGYVRALRLIRLNRFILRGVFTSRSPKFVDAGNDR